MLDTRCATEQHELSFAESLDFGALELSGRHVLPEPVLATGRLYRRADMLLLELELSSTLDLCCDLCATEFHRPLSLSISVTLVESMEGEEDERDDIFVTNGPMVDLAELALPYLIFAQDSRTLCRPDCRGLCPRCGANRNDTDCDCAATQIDPRLEALKAFFEE